MEDYDMDKLSRYDLEDIFSGLCEVENVQYLRAKIIRMMKVIYQADPEKLLTYKLTLVEREDC